MNQAEKRRIEEESLGVGSVTKNEYDSYKRKAINFEKTNLKYILVLPCSGQKGWCEMADNSALIYKYAVCWKTGNNPDIHDDFDSFYDRYAIGKIRTRGFDVVRRRIKEAGMYKGEIKKDKCIFFELKEPFDKKAMEEMRTEEDLRQLELGQIVKVKFADPRLFQMMAETETRLHRICFHRLDRLSSETNGRRIVEAMDKMLLNYYLMSEKGTSGSELELDDWREMRESTHIVIYELQLLAALRLWRKSQCASITEEVVEIEKQINKHILAIERSAKRKAQAVEAETRSGGKAKIEAEVKDVKSEPEQK